MTIGDLQTLITDTPNHPADPQRVAQAYQVAAAAHKDQRRRSGEPYIQHPLHVARTLAHLKLDTDTLCAALLHDTVEDTDVTIHDIRTQFGPVVARLVESVTKLHAIHETARSTKNSLPDPKPTPQILTEKERLNLESLRNMLVSAADDVRVVLIKLADRYHNMLTIESLPLEKQRRIAKETLYVYAPIADRLGIGEMRTQLQDVSFPILFPKEAAHIQHIFKEALSRREDALTRTAQHLESLLPKHGIQPISLHGRVKGLYSLYRKLLRNHNDLQRIYDLAALRIVVSTQEECYQALGVIHGAYRPMIGRIKDYIAVPKPNGYQSLHTTIITQSGTIMEVQIRTEAMHQHTEHGVVAHWVYDQTKDLSAELQEQLKDSHTAWLKQLSQWRIPTDSPTEFSEHLETDLFTDRIFVFTPSGDILDLPEGATALDFAYTIHTNLGHSAISARIHNQERPLSSVLQNGDIVHITTQAGNTEAPQRAWLSFVHTNTAKRAIKEWLAKRTKEEQIEAGTSILDEHIQRVYNKRFHNLNTSTRKRVLEKLNLHDESDLFLAIGKGDVSPRTVVQHLFSVSELTSGHLATDDRTITLLVRTKENRQAELIHELSAALKTQPNVQVRTLYIDNRGRRKQDLAYVQVRVQHVKHIQDAIAAMQQIPMIASIQRLKRFPAIWF